MDHFLTKAESMKARMTAQSDEFEPEVLQAIQEWLTRQAAG